MATKPCIKGSVYSATIEDVKKLLASGELSREEARRWLQDEDLPFLEREISVALWYDVRSYDRLNCLLRDVEGGGSNEYLREKGRGTARRLLEMGLYSQLEYLQNTRVSKTLGGKERFDAFARDLARLNTLSAIILNFTKWKAIPDPDHERRYLLEVSEARDMPETLVWRTDGFTNEMATLHGEVIRDLWTWRREHVDVVVFRMTREI